MNVLGNMQSAGTVVYSTGLKASLVNRRQILWVGGEG